VDSVPRARSIGEVADQLRQRLDDLPADLALRRAFVGTYTERPHR
jgi:hypothetical protein